MNVKDFCKTFRISESKVRNGIKSGDIPCFARKGREIDIDVDSVDIDLIRLRKSRKRLSDEQRRLRTKALANSDQYHIKHENARLFRKYGLSLDSANFMLGSQKGLCKICDKKLNYFYEPKTNTRIKTSKKDKPHIDHCHSTGSVRGILCSNCNTALGLLYDNPDTLRSAIKYLEDETNK